MKFYNKIQYLKLCFLVLKVFGLNFIFYIKILLIINPLASPSAGAHALKYGDVNT